MKTSDYAQDLKTAINPNWYSTLIVSLGRQLNNRGDRFDKAMIIEQSLEEYSNFRLKWVDDIGRDHRDTVANTDLEFKYMSNGLFTAKGKPKSIIKVKLKNSLGANKGTIIENPADFYLLGQENAIAIISANDLKPYLVSVADGIEAHIPFEKLDFVFLPEDVGEVTPVEVNYKEEKIAMQRRLIESIKQ